MAQETRVAYGEELAKLIKENKNIVVLDADLTKSTKTIEVKKACPERLSLPHPLRCLPQAEPGKSSATRSATRNSMSRSAQPTPAYPSVKMVLPTRLVKMWRS